jgi:hypothetical protein
MLLVSHIGAASHGVSVRVITSLLLNFASFLRRAKGDLETAEVVLRRSADVSNGPIVTTYS